MASDYILLLHFAKVVQIIFKAVKTSISLLLIICILLASLGQCAYAEPVKVNLTADERNRLDTFFSNFAKTTFEPFACGAIKDEDLIRFGLNYLAHSKYNSKLFVKISIQELDKVTTHYFDKVAKNHSNISGWILTHGFYHKIIFPEELLSLSQIDELWDNLNTGSVLSPKITFDAEELPSFSQIVELGGRDNVDRGVSPKIAFAAKELPSFSQIDELWDNGDSTFTAIVSVYRQINGWKGDPHGMLEKWSKDDLQHCPQPKGNYRAIISLDYSENSERYILREYLLNDRPVSLKNEDDNLSQ